MLATIEKTVTDTVMEPTVTYDKKNSKIIATVIVSLSPGGGISLHHRSFYHDSRTRVFTKPRNMDSGMGARS